MPHPKVDALSEQGARQSVGISKVVHETPGNTFTRSQCRFPDGRVRDWSGFVYGDVAKERAAPNTFALDHHNNERWKQLGFAAGKTLRSRAGDLNLVRANGVASEFESEFDDPSALGISLTLCCSGGGRLRRGSDTQKRNGEFRPGMLDLHLPSKGGFVVAPGSRNLGVGIRPAKLTWLIANVGVQKAVQDCDPGCFFQDALLTQLLINVVTLAEDNAISTVFLDHALHLIVARLFERPVETTPGRSSLTARELRLVCEFIDANLGQDIGLAELSSLVALSPGEFSRRFRKSLGLPPYAYLKQQRLRRAGELLAQSDMAVAHIGHAVGYSSPTQFTKAFRMENNMTPSEWRRSQMS